MYKINTELKDTHHLWAHSKEVPDWTQQNLETVFRIWILELHLVTTGKTTDKVLLRHQMLEKKAWPPRSLSFIMNLMYMEGKSFCPL